MLKKQEKKGETLANKQRDLSTEGTHKHMETLNILTITDVFLDQERHL